VGGFVRRRFWLPAGERGVERRDQSVHVAIGELGHDEVLRGRRAGLKGLLRYGRTRPDAE